MRIKLDENLPIALVGTLTQLGHDTDSVQEEGLQGASDPDVWAAAQAAERFLWMLLHTGPVRVPGT
jgi:predicted nuclease of predicted toxin-antitoxin system